MLFVFVLSELLLSNDQVALVQMEPNLMDDSVPRDNKELTGISESIHDPITFESQNLYGWFPYGALCFPVFSNWHIVIYRG